MTTNTPPQFKTNLDYLVLSPDFEFIYTLPESSDKEGDMFTTNINLKDSFTFTKINGKTFEFKPTLSDIGEHSISVVL